jgi:hypothetical protein
MSSIEGWRYCHFTFQISKNYLPNEISELHPCPTASALPRVILKSESGAARSNTPKKLLNECTKKHTSAGIHKFRSEPKSRPVPDQDPNPAAQQATKLAMSAPVEMPSLLPTLYSWKARLQTRHSGVELTLTGSPQTDHLPEIDTREVRK